MDFNKKEDVDCTPSGTMLKVNQKYKVNEYQTFGFSSSLSNKQYFEQLKKVLYKYGPFTTAVRVGEQSLQWSYYKSGLFKFSSSNCQMKAKVCSTDHQIMVFGYGTTSDGEDYLVIRNSWGDDWGENGYMRIAVDNDGTAMCGIGWDLDDKYKYTSNGLVNKKSQVDGSDDNNNNDDNDDNDNDDNNGSLLNLIVLAFFLILVF